MEFLSYKETLQIVLNNLIKEFRKCPIKYFYEEDLRSDLLIRLTNEKIFNINLPITNSNEWLKDYALILGKETDISGIKAEYPSTLRFDIAYIKHTNESNHYINECQFAIEIKLSQNDNKNRDFKLDIDKLEDYKNNHKDFMGIAINFEQNPLINKKSIFENYNNPNMKELSNEIELFNNSINCFFIHHKFILGYEKYNLG